MKIITDCLAALGLTTIVFAVLLWINGYGIHVFGEGRLICIWN